MVCVTFVMEQHVGLYSYYQYLRRFMDLEADIEATWVPVTYFDPHSALRRLTFLPAGVRSALHGRAQVRQGIARRPGTSSSSTPRSRRPWPTGGSGGAATSSAPM